LAPLAAAALLLMTPEPARAEFGVSVWIGGGVQSEPNNLDTFDGAAFAIDGEYWLPGGLNWLGFDVGFLYNNYDFTVGNLRQEMSLMPISTVVKARIPLFKSDARPEGLFQPYIAAGPGFYVNTVRGPAGSSAGIDVGADVRLGFNLQISRAIGLFGEYRYQYVRLTGLPPIAAFPGGLSVIQNNMVGAGVVFRFFALEE
jgi:hypothetical protein